MNGKPHVHQLEFDRQWRYLENKGHHVVRYGDTAVRVHRGPFFEARLLRGAKRAVRKHDRGSIRAQEHQDAMEDITRRIQTATADFLFEGDQWPSKR